MKKFADFNVSHFLSTLSATATWLIADCIYDVTQTREKKKEKEKRKLGHATKSEQQFTTQFSPMLPRINRTIHDSKKGASHFWILCDLIVESSISASHNKPECSRPGTEETFNRFNGSASVQCWLYETDIILSSWSVIGCLDWNVIWVTIQEFD